MRRGECRFAVACTHMRQNDIVLCKIFLFSKGHALAREDWEVELVVTIYGEDRAIKGHVVKVTTVKP